MRKSLFKDYKKHLRYIMKRKGFFDNDGYEVEQILDRIKNRIFFFENDMMLNHYGL